MRKKIRTSKTRQVEYVADRRSNMIDPLQSERGLAAEPVEEDIQRTYLK